MIWKNVDNELPNENETVIVAIDGDIENTIECRYSDKTFWCSMDGFQDVILWKRIIKDDSLKLKETLWKYSVSV